MTPREKKIIKAALEEDIGRGDITTAAIIPQDTECVFEITAKEKLVLAGLSTVKACYAHLDPDIQCKALVKDGIEAQPDQVLMTVRGNARYILMGERTVLNFLQRMSGVATLTKKFIDKAAPHGVKIFDTRKTTPGIRIFEKYAVTAGGGYNHRLGLYDGIMLKDNHKDILRRAGSDFSSAIKRFRLRYKRHKIVVEADNLHEALESARGGADIVCLDNMTPQELVIIIKELKPFSVVTEASGGITLDNIEAYAKTGIDRISIGAITHSARAVDITMHIQ